MTLLTMIAKMSEGLGKTCAIFFLTILFSLPLGMLITLLRMSKDRVVSGVTRFVIAVLRGTPLMLQLLAVTYGPYYLFGMAVAKNKLIPVVIAFAINYAAYFAEIYRGGIESIPVGQYEAANVLGYTRAQTFLRIILPQVVKRIMPSITNEVVTLVKDTSMAFTVSYHHRQADRKLPDQLHAVPCGGRVLLRVQCHRRFCHGQDRKAHGLPQIRRCRHERIGTQSRQKIV